MITFDDRPENWWKLSLRERFRWCNQNLTQVYVPYAEDPGFIVRVLAIDGCTYYSVSSVSTFRPGAKTGWDLRILPELCKVRSSIFE